MKIETEDKINPTHYKDAGYFVQPIDVTQELPFCLGNAVKYMARAGKKAGASELEDLKKALWYVERQLDLWSPGCADDSVHLSCFGSAAVTVLRARGACGYALSLFRTWEDTHLAYADTETLEEAATWLRGAVKDLEASICEN